MYIMPPEQSTEFGERKYSAKLKKFNSERNLFFTNLYNGDSGHSYNINNNNYFNYNKNNNSSVTSAAMTAALAPNEKPLSRVERTKSFLKNGLMKKWKSSKELFMPSHSKSTTTTATAAIAVSQNSTDPTNKQCRENNKQNFINEKLLDNLDEFERNFLLSAGRKILVKELRKNFEKPNGNPVPRTNTSQSLSTGVTHVTQNRSITTSDIVNTGLSASEKSKILANELQNFINADNNNGPKKVILSRHSFYNTYRTEYLASHNNHYSSNVSLNYYGNGNSISDKTLTKTFNKYNNFIKSSSTINLSTIPMVNSGTAPETATVAIQTTPLSSSISANNKRNMNKNLNTINNVQMNDKLCNLKHVCSLNSLNTTMTYDSLDHYPNDTQSLIIPNTTFNLHDKDDDENVQNANINTDIDCTSADLYKIYVENNQKYNRNDYFNNNSNDIVNNNVKLRKCNSVNQIDLDLLKNELDDYIDIKWRSTNFSNGFIAQRRYHFNSQYKKVR